ncbi:MAG: diacylglycerol/lipid kinase family protein, partial [Marinobacter sp.]
MTDWLLANPKAGRGERNARFWQAHLADAGVRELRLCDLEDQRWMEEVRPGDRILVAGGDGSVNAAARLCLDTDTTLAVLPSGTANDFFRNLGIDDAPEAICQAVADNITHQFDIAEFDGGIYLNVAHVGLATLPARDANASGGTKKRLGRFSYGLSLLRRLFSKRGFRATIHTDQGAATGRWLSVSVANGAWFGGGIAVPGASAVSGELVIIAVRPTSLPALSGAFVLTRFLGRPPRASKTVMEMKGPWCRITT